MSGITEKNKNLTGLSAKYKINIREIYRHSGLGVFTSELISDKCAVLGYNRL